MGEKRHRLLTLLCMHRAGSALQLFQHRILLDAGPDNDAGGRAELLAASATVSRPYPAKLLAGQVDRLHRLGALELVDRQRVAVDVDGRHGAALEPLAQRSDALGGEGTTAVLDTAERVAVQAAIEEEMVLSEKQALIPGGFMHAGASRLITSSAPQKLDLGRWEHLCQLVDCAHVLAVVGEIVLTKAVGQASKISHQEGRVIPGGICMIPKRQAH